MSDMMIPDKDQPSLYDENPPESLSFLARARTLTVLPRLNGNRKGRVMQFLQGSRLIHKDSPVLSLYKADLRGIVLRGSDPWRSDLSEANLSQAMLHKADLSWADLSWVDLSHANLSHANLYRAVLREANLTLVLLTGIDLREAYLREAYKITWEGKKEPMPNEELEDRAKTPEGASMLEGATMPNGQKYEEWLKSRGEDGKNTGP